MGREKTGRPENRPIEERNYHDLEKRLIYIPDNYIITRMIDPSALATQDGRTDGRYGTGKYGRCVYAEYPIGIYGTDTYGKSTYG